LLANVNKAMRVNSDMRFQRFNTTHIIYRDNTRIVNKINSNVPIDIKQRGSNEILF